MPIVSDGFRPLEFLISEASGQRSRERAVVKAGSGVLQAGRVLAIESATSKLVPFNPAGTGGAQFARAVLGYGVDATSADQAATVFARDCEVDDALLTWGTADAVAIADARVELAGVGILTAGPDGAHLAPLGGDAGGSVDPATGSFIGPAGELVPIANHSRLVLNGATAGQASAWLPIAAYDERLIYQLTSGSTLTQFAIDVSADGVTSLGQAFTGTWQSSTVARRTRAIAFSHPLARYFRISILAGGPISFARGA